MDQCDTKIRLMNYVWVSDLYFQVQGCCAQSLVIYGPPADKRDLTTKSENLKVMHILKLLSM